MLKELKSEKQRFASEMCKKLRKNATKWERRAKYKLDRLYSNVKFQKAFFPRTGGIYIVDFFIPSKGLIVEIDGGQHGKGPQYNKDVKRDKYFTSIGYHVVRIKNTDLVGLNMREYIEMALEVAREEAQFVL